jgi:hypothetical protein
MIICYLLLHDVMAMALSLVVLVSFELLPHYHFNFSTGQLLKSCAEVKSQPSCHSTITIELLPHCLVNVSHAQLQESCGKVTSQPSCHSTITLELVPHCPVNLSRAQLHNVNFCQRLLKPRL